MLADVARDQQFVTDFHCSGTGGNWFEQFADAGCVEEQLIGRSARDDFCVSCHDCDTRQLGGLCDTLQNAP